MSPGQPAPGRAAAAEIDRAVETLRQVDERLDALLGDAVDSVTAGNGKTLLARWVPLAGQSRAGEPAPAAPRAAGVPGQGLLDLVLLAEISGGDQLAQAEMPLDFRRVNNADARTLRCAADVADFAQVSQFSHRIRGSSLMLGATRLGQACEHVEVASAARDAAQLSAAMGSFEIELLRLDEYLNMFPSVPQRRA